MPEFYLDLETFSPTKPIDCDKDPIISIAYQQINAQTGEILTPLSILKSWESNEQEILKKFYETFNIHNRWSFIPVGYKLVDFDFIMLGTHWRKYGINVNAKELYNHPYIDIYPVALLCNGGRFQGCSLKNIAGKQDTGASISDWYIKKDYKAIEDYIADEAKAFTKFYAFLANKLPMVIKEYKENGNG